MSLPPYLILHKNVGETPLDVLENWRKGTREASLVPLAYAGRLDPMAEGKLLMLIGDECKVQTKYHGLDKEYQITIALDLASDSGDVLGIINSNNKSKPSQADIEKAVRFFVGEVEFTYPIFSSKTVQGKPLHTWAVEGRLHEIEIPKRTATIYKINDLKTYSISRQELVTKALTKIMSLPKVTDPRKALGNDFRRPEVLASWDKFQNTGDSQDQFLLIDLTVTCSSGMYMRTLAELIAEKLDTTGLALKINRTKIGHYDVTNSEFSKEYN
jgi:tRNA pseudouridine(55) synthase